MQMTISAGFEHDTAAVIMREEQWPHVSADAEKQRRRSLRIIDGLVSVTQQAWGVQARGQPWRETAPIGG
jgi:hypothetical protein